METLGDNCGYFHSLQEAYTFILELETQSTTKFTCHKADKGFGAIGENRSLHVAPLIQLTATSKIWT